MHTSESVSALSVMFVSDIRLVFMWLMIDVFQGNVKHTCYLGPKWTYHPPKLIYRCCTN